MNDEILLLQLRDCFTAGYTLPQFCVEQNIKKPLFIAPNENYITFLWEVHVQFDFDKRIAPIFVILNSQDREIRLSPGTLFGALNLKNADEIFIDDYDAVIALSAQRFQPEIKNCIYLDNLLNYFIVHTYVDIPFLHFLRRHPKIKFFLTNFPTIQPNENNSQNENELLQKNPYLLDPMRKSLKNDTSGEVTTPYDVFGYTRQDILDLLDTQEIFTQADGSTIFKDNPKPLVRIENGKRVTADQPDKFINRIYFVGGCSHYGTGAPFDKTIPSCLQKLLNQAALPYRVENYSQFFTYRYQDILYNLNTLPLMPNDIVIVFFDNIISPYLPCIDVSQTFLRPHNYGEVFIDSAHVNETGYKVLAEQFFNFLTQNNFFKEINFQYPPRLLCRTVTAYRVNTAKIFQSMRNWTHTKTFCANVDKKSVA